MSFQVNFWGVRGSIPTPLAGDVVREKAHALIQRYREAGSPDDISAFIANDPSAWTYGGNTSCVEVLYRDKKNRRNPKRIVLDMGTGLRPLGDALMRKMCAQKGLDITFLVSHVHWDHIQGLPFFRPLYINKETGIKNHWLFYGGSDIECLRRQMEPPMFPVAWDEVASCTEHIALVPFHDRESLAPRYGSPRITCRTLNHPQETYGWRIEGSQGEVLVYATDNEPYDPRHPDEKLLDLAHEADVLIIDCQYSQHTYNGLGSEPSRRGWGHSYPEAVAQVALQAHVKKVILFHHDPASSDAKIRELEDQTKTLLASAGVQIEVIAAYEGFQLAIP